MPLSAFIVIELEEVAFVEDEDSVYLVGARKAEICWFEDSSMLVLASRTVMSQSIADENHLKPSMAQGPKGERSVASLPSSSCLSRGISEA